MSAHEFRFSVFLSTVFLDAGILLAHGPRQQRIVLDAAWERCVRDLSGVVFGPEAFADLAPNRAAAPGVLQALRERHLIVPAGRDEEAALRASFTDRPESSGHDPAAAAAGSWPVTRYGLPPRLSDAAASAAGAGEAVRVLLIGGCVTQFTEEPLHALGREPGLDVRTEHVWPGPSAGLARAVRRSRPDVTVHQPGVQPFPTFGGRRTTRCCAGRTSRPPAVSWAGLGARDRARGRSHAHRRLVPGGLRARCPLPSRLRPLPARAGATDPAPATRKLRPDRWTRLPQEGGCDP
ncbi:hypothetical protein [Streptomyces sp. NPDC001781]